MPASNLLDQGQRRLRLGPSGRLGYTAIEGQPVAILHQHVGV
jgi:hypothetical protein